MQPRDRRPQRPLAANAWRRARGKGGRERADNVGHIRAGSAARGARRRSPRPMPMPRGRRAVLAPAHRSGSVPPAGCIRAAGGNVFLKTRGAGATRVARRGASPGAAGRKPTDDDRRRPPVASPWRLLFCFLLCCLPTFSLSAPWPPLCSVPGRRSAAPSRHAARPRARGRRVWSEECGTVTACCTPAGAPRGGRQRRRWRAPCPR